VIQMKLIKEKKPKKKGKYLGKDCACADFD
jgi:hypothetical protein